MTVVAAVPAGREALTVLDAAVTEAGRLNTDLLLVNLALSPLPPFERPADLAVEVVERRGPGDRDPVDAVLDEIEARPAAARLVIGLRRRSPVSKALLGSVSQRLLLNSPIPVLAVKPSDSDHQETR